MVAGELVAPAAAQRRSLDHVDVRSILPEEVHVDGDQVPDRLADVAREVERLQEGLGDHDRGAEVDEYAAVQSRGDRGQGAKVPEAGAADGGAIGARVHMNDV